jgi:signal transduction histidine kinase
MIGIAIQKIRLFEQVQNGQEQMRTLSRKLMETQENERRRLSRELHDEVGQALTALKINLQVLQRTDIESAQQLQECINIVNHTLQEIRQLSLDLRPSLLDDLGLVAALRWHVDYHSRLSGLGAKFITNLSNIRLPSQLEITCYRIVQESFTNVVKHSQAANVQVELISQDNKIHLFVRDDGLGFDVDAVNLDVVWGKGLGLLGMKERIALVGGQIEINSLAARGTEIHAMFDWPQQNN